MKQKQNRTKQMKKYLKKETKKALKTYRQKHNICMHRNTVKNTKLKTTIHRKRSCKVKVKNKALKEHYNIELVFKVRFT